MMLMLIEYAIGSFQEFGEVELELKKSTRWTWRYQR